MIQSLLLTLAPVLFAGEDHLEKIAAAGADVARLWELSRSFDGDQTREEQRAVLARILEVDPDHEGARKGLRHHRYDGRWFETYAELSRYRRAEDARMLAEHGLVRFRDQWILPRDVPFARMGWVREEGGQWTSPVRLTARAREAERTAEGWQQQDLTWVHPDDFDKWREGLWKCGDRWLTVEEADRFHSQLGQWWELAGEHYVALGTLDRGGMEWARHYADNTWADLVRLFGLTPRERPELLVLREVDQYNTFAGGDPNAGVDPTESTGHSSVHYAYFAEAWFDQQEDRGVYRGSGVCYWDRSDEQLSPFGRHAVRHAAAQSFVEGIDPSWETVSLILTGGEPFQGEAFWGEKRVPRWLRYGACAYVERYFRDPDVGEDGNPWWTRDWSIGNIVSQGGLGELEAIFAFQLDSNDIEGSRKRINESGLLVSFILDGGCAPVIEKHRAFKQALREDGDAAEAAEALQQAVLENRGSLMRYAGL